MSEQQETVERNARKLREGVVVSDKMDKTVVVSVEDRVKHALYGKVMRRTSRLKAHDEQNDAHVGDRVLVMETRPLSATKRWRVVEILGEADGWWKVRTVDDTRLRGAGIAAPGIEGLAAMRRYWSSYSSDNSTTSKPVRRNSRASEPKLK